MNYLAHLVLAEPNDASRLGGLLGDFMRGHQIADFPPDVAEGVLRHRAIDRFTDGHAVVRRSKARLDDRFRRYAGVIVDVFYDHFLARDFATWCRGNELPEFAQAVYGMLERRLPALSVVPERMQVAVPRMIRQDWLTSYREVRHVGSALHGISRRVRRENPIAEAVRELERHYDGLQEDFDEFFPDVREHLAQSDRPRCSSRRNQERSRR